MKEKPSEWVAIADLMAGVTAVVMLLLVMSVVQNRFAEIRHKAEMEQGAEAQRQQLSKLLGEMKAAFARQGSESMVAIDVAAGKITLRDRVFLRGSACITDEAKQALAQVEGNIAEYLGRVADGQIYIEGHTDNVEVKHEVLDSKKYCAVYDDNFTLSAARARQARRLMTGGLSTDTARRVVVAGYGDSHLLAGIPPDDAANRRVEVRFAR